MNKPTREDYRFLIDAEWKDIHHSRMQEWTALGIVAGAQVGIITLLNSLKAPVAGVSLATLVLFTTITGILFSLIGVFLTMRHRQLMIIKIGWILKAETKLGLIFNKKNPEGIIPHQELDIKKKKNWRGLALPRLLSTSGLIMLVYCSFILLDILIMIIFLN